MIKLVLASIRSDLQSRIRFLVGKEKILEAHSNNIKKFENKKIYCLLSLSRLYSVMNNISYSDNNLFYGASFVIQTRKNISIV